MTQADLQKILESHAEWLAGKGGKRASLSRADLRGASLSGADLSGADLSVANLSRANLSGADLRGADLSGADLRGADLSDANLRGASLSGADLSGADLSDANLRGASLRGATGFDPSAHLAAFWIVPEVGAFVGWKKLRDGVIAQLEIPADARRTSSTKSRKCRAEYIRTLALFDADGSPFVGPCASLRDVNCIYSVGEETRPDSYDDSMIEDCSNGIHFFITRQEAAAY